MKKTTFKSLLAVMLAFMLAFTALLPAMAEEETTTADDVGASTGYTITIKPADGTNKDVEDRFEAYQIFSGDVVDGALDKLSNIVWAESVDGDALLDKLIKNETIGELVEAAVTGKAAKAAALAELLDANKTDDDFVEAFSRVVGNYFENAGIEASGKSVFDGNNFVIGGLDAGYYIVIDTYNADKDNDDDERSAYILKVANNRELGIKSKVPTIDKEIVDADDGKGNGTTAEIGSIVKFKLTGTLSSENFGRYKEYYYEFIDTLSAGLTLNAGSIKITAKKAGAEDIDITEMKDGDGELLYTFTAPENDGKNGKFSIKFEDIQKVTGLTGDYAIVVEYTATVNEDAVMYGSAESNSAKLVFSNDPYSNGKGETTEDVVYVTSFELKFVKQDSSKNPLAGATFKLYKMVGGEKVYANLTGTLPYLKLDEDADKATWDANGTSFTTDTDGKFNIAGLEAGTYYLEEIAAPDGYSKIDDIKIDIEVTFNTNGTVATEKVTVTATNSATTDVGEITTEVEDETAEGGKVTKGTGVYYITNYKVSELPSTGGMGTTIFYVLGSVVLAAAVVFLVISKKKARA